MLSYNPNNKTNTNILNTNTSISYNRINTEGNTIVKINIEELIKIQQKILEIINLIQSGFLGIIIGFFIPDLFLISREKVLNKRMENELFIHIRIR